MTDPDAVRELLTDEYDEWCVYRIDDAGEWFHYVARSRLEALRTHDELHQQDANDWVGETLTVAMCEPDAELSIGFDDDPSDFLGALSGRWKRTEDEYSAWVGYLNATCAEWADATREPVQICASAWNG